MERVGSVKECLFALLESFPLLLFPFDEVLLLSGDPISVSDLVLFGLELKLQLVEFLPHLVFLSVELRQLLLLKGDLILELVKLLLNVITMFLGVFEFLADCLNLAFLLLNFSVEHTQFLINTLALRVQLINDGLDLLDSLCAWDGLLHLLDVSKHLLFVLILEGGGLVSSLHVLNCLLDLSRHLLIFTRRKQLEKSLSFHVEAGYLVVDKVLLSLEFPLLLADTLKRLHFLLEEVLEGHGRP